METPGKKVLLTSSGDEISKNIAFHLAKRGCRFESYSQALNSMLSMRAWLMRKWWKENINMNSDSLNIILSGLFYWYIFSQTDGSKNMLFIKFA